jgi:cytidine deaminase
MSNLELIQVARNARENAYAPYSGFRVGAALLCEDGAVFTGCNVENAAYGSTICAERTALVKAVSEGKQDGFLCLAIAGSGEEVCWPCGACRQMLFEFAPNLKILAIAADGTYEESSLHELLPHGFGAAALTNLDQ